MELTNAILGGDILHYDDIDYPGGYDVNLNMHRASSYVEGIQTSYLGARR